MFRRFADGETCFEWIVQCPCCGGETVSHGAVEVFERREDAKEGLHVAVNHETVSVDGNLEGNPSTRRDGFTVTFWCDSCHGHFVWHVAQSKGSTDMRFEWVSTDLSDEHGMPLG